MQDLIRFAKHVGSLPAVLTPNAVYAVRTGVGFDLYISDSTGSVAHGLNAPGGPSAPSTIVSAAGAAQVMPANTIVTAQFSTVEQGDFDLAGSYWTCPEAGEYTIGVGAQMELQTNAEYYVFLFVNGARKRDMLHDVAPAYGYYGGATSAVIHLTAGDRVDVRVYCNPTPGTLQREPFRTFASFSKR